MHAFCHCLPGLWHQMAVHLSAASCIDFAARLTGAAGAADLFARAEAAGPASGPELFLPYLSGERTPHNDPQVRGAFLQLDNDTTPERLAQAVLEGVAFALGDGLDALRDAGTEVVAAVGDRRRRALALLGRDDRCHAGRRAGLPARRRSRPRARRGAAGADRGRGRQPGRGLRRARRSRTASSPTPTSPTRLAPKIAEFRAAYPRITPKSHARSV